jgi:hypothetical protein
VAVNEIVRALLALGEARQAAGEFRDIGMEFAGWEKGSGSGGEGNKADSIGGILNSRGVTVNATGEDIDLDAAAAKLTSQLADVDVHAASVACAPKWREGRGVQTNHRDTRLL